MIIDIIIIVLLVLACVIGFIKGFSIKRLTPALLCLSFFVAYMVGIPLARLLMNTKFGYSLIQGAYYNNIPNSGIFIESVDQENYLSQFKKGLTELNIPSFFQGLFTNRVIDYSLDVRTALASSFASLTLSASCFLLIFLIAFIVLRLILKPIWDTAFGEEGKNINGRIFGLVLTASKMVLTILCVLIVVSLVNQLMVKFGNNTLNDFLVDDLKLASSSFSIGKFFYSTASSLLTWISA